MGLFQTVRPQEDFPYGGYLYCTPPRPFHYDLILEDNTGTILDVVEILKHWMHPAIERTELEVNGFCGTLFKPSGDGPFNAIIDMSGTGGGIHEHKGAALASEGYVVLCVAYFRYKNLPSELDNVDLNYFKKPIEWLLSRPYTTDIIGLQGVSFGAALVNILAVRYPQIRAVVSINGAHFKTTYINVSDNGVRPPTYFAYGDKTRFQNGLFVTRDVVDVAADDIPECARINFNEVSKDTAFRFIASVDDLAVPTITASRYCEKRLKAAGCYVEVDTVSGGHLMEPPYFPLHAFVYSAFLGFQCAYGGEATLHGRSQERTWANTVRFFRERLGAPCEMPDLDAWLAERQEVASSLIMSHL